MGRIGAKVKTFHLGPKVETN